MKPIIQTSKSPHSFQALCSVQQLYKSWTPKERATDYSCLRNSMSHYPLKKKIDIRHLRLFMTAGLKLHIYPQFGEK